MSRSPGARGLIMNEPLLWEKGRPGRSAYSLPRPDVPSAALDESLVGEGPDFPDLSELDVVRHYTRLSQWNFGLDTGMYPLGSCTMKYNPKIHERLAARPGFAAAHPLLPAKLSQGVLRMMYELERFLAEITGMDAVTLQPAAGAQGELTGLLILAAHHRRTGEPRSKIIVPDTAHGTNPASAALCGFQPVRVSSDARGVLAPERVADVMDDQTAGIMVTNPNTLGLFEEHLRAICDIVHAKGGLVYCDGANLNAVMGLVDMGRIGIDVMHLNLHKTFATPHGGGGPGAGPVCVKANLEKYLPVPRIVEKEGFFSLSEDYPDSIGRLHAFYGNVGVMIKAFAYILSMGAVYLKKASQLAVLNANYVKQRLKDVLHLPYDRPGLHECVFSDRTLKKLGITTLDLAKALIDRGYHPPTIYFPLVVEGALMVEPTESESREDLDQFVDTLRALLEEAATDPGRLKKAPEHTRVKRLDEAQAARKPRLAG